jgi:hypothetical protein
VHVLVELVETRLVESGWFGETSGPGASRHDTTTPSVGRAGAGAMQGGVR